MKCFACMAPQACFHKSRIEAQAHALKKMLGAFYYRCLARPTYKLCFATRFGLGMLDFRVVEDSADIVNAHTPNESKGPGSLC